MNQQFLKTYSPVSQTIHQPGRHDSTQSFDRAAYGQQSFDFNSQNYPVNNRPEIYTT